MSSSKCRFSVYYSVSVGGNIRFESVFLEDAQNFARHIYASEKSIAAIHEVQR